jgi:hypothetical protein
MPPIDYRKPTSWGRSDWEPMLTESAIEAEVSGWLTKGVEIPLPLSVNSNFSFNFNEEILRNLSRPVVPNGPFANLTRSHFFDNLSNPVILAELDSEVITWGLSQAKMKEFARRATQDLIEEASKTACEATIKPREMKVSASFSFNLFAGVNFGIEATFDVVDVCELLAQQLLRAQPF